ncbi:pilus assembly protein N-terminal domain-containing protein [Pseudorhodoplanes sp.]|uniref:pilus assembly protein N-terminal domain-containing protein n=1 Tax=Pseudorhodoplanes sp. TaxID=1934341 RepID=UPI003D12CBA0
MAARCGVFGSVRRIARMVAVAAALAAAPAQAEDFPGGDRLKVSLDEAKLIKLPDRVATIVIGNPLIADATLQPGGLAVLTGKGYGATNFIALDRKGNALLEKTIQVDGPKNTVVMYKGVNRETYNCAPTCEPMITPGDFQQFFNQNLVQTTTRSTQATSMSAPR